MRNIRLVIEYDGTGYCGWQRQINGTSVQEIIEKALGRVLRQDTVLIGSGRTDSGVHARGQVANFKTNSRLTLRKILFGLNANLPKDISIKNAEEVGSGFHARFKAKSKLYRYTVLNAIVSSPLTRHYSYQCKTPLDIRLMRIEAAALFGRRDFSSFKAKDKRGRSSTTSIKKLSITKKGRYVYFDIEATGFLYNMARNIVGTLVEIGRGKMEEGTIKKVLRKKDRRFAGPTAPARGLCLEEVKY